MSPLPTVGIVRHQLFRPSETFIASQALALRRFRPLFVGRDRVPPRPGVDSVSVSQRGRAALLAYTLARTSGPLCGLLRERPVALLHAHFGVEGVYATTLARSLRVPLVTTLHGFDVTIGKRHMITSRKPSWINYVVWRRMLFDECRLFICVSDYIRRRAIEWGYPEERTIVLPIGVDVEVVQPGEFVEAPRIIHVARLVQIKGTADLLRAFAIVKQVIPKAKLVIIGDGPLRASLISLSRSLGVAASVRFLGAQDHSETLRWMRQSRLLCLPSVTATDGSQEGLGMVLLEAAAAGKPVVGTNHGGIPEAVTDGLNGFLVPEHDVAVLADRLLALLKDPELCEQLGKAGREAVVERFNLRRQTDKLESLYRELM